MKQAAGVGATLGAAAKAFARPAAKASSRRVLGANDRINVGVIGVGGRGSYLARTFAGNRRAHQRLQSRGCVRRVRESANARTAEKLKCDGYLDYREVINKPDIDAIVVATPDHWHAKIALEAMDNGKDVYLEKPMCHTIEEAKQLAATVQETKRVLPGGFADHFSRTVVESQESHRRRHDRQDAHEPGFVSPQLGGRRMELAHRRRSGT